MRIVVEHGKTKREINGAFNICGSREDMIKIAHAINEALERDFGYGWVKIVDKCESIPNTEPLKWD